MTVTSDFFPRPSRVPAAIDIDALIDRTWADARPPAPATPNEADTEAITGDVILRFGKRYLPHAVEIEPSLFHREACDEVARIHTSPDSERSATAAPRSNAKTTWLVTINALFSVTRRLKKFIVIISDTATQANERLAEIKSELEGNDALAEAYPEACGRGWRWTNADIITRNGVRILALGSGMKIRGRKFGHVRPDLILVDDMENDENTRSKDQRNKLYDWFTKAVLKAKGVRKKSDTVVVGTVMHFDSVLARLLDRKKSPGWRSKKYKAVIRWADNKALWDEWERRYTDWSLSDDERQAAADAFFLEHEAEMLEGTEVLWPQGEPYYKLMKDRIDDGPRAFDSEKQNEPIDPSTCEFPEEWIQWFDEIPIDGETWLVPDVGERVRLADCDRFAAVDPSMGKKDKHGDPSAIIGLAAWPARRLWDTFPKPLRNYRLFLVTDASIKRRHPHVIQADLIELHRLRRFQRVGIEAIQFQELFAEHVQEAALDDASIADLHVRELKPNTDKRLRIQKLGPFIYPGRIKLGRKCVELFNQLRYYTGKDDMPDDGPDALELAMEVAGAIGWVVMSDDDDFQEEPLATTERQQIAQVYRRPPISAGEKCGNCANAGVKNGQPWCLARLFQIQLADPGCDTWEPATGD